MSALQLQLSTSTHREAMFAPAKINLSLRLLGRRSDGYHEIETLMMPIALADELEISHAHGAQAGAVTLICNDPTLPTDEKNLCVKAARAFQQASGIEEAVAITLLKRIPHGAGLGGGSSDAATVLQGMNALFHEPLVAEELHELAAKLGSDVPFFLEKKTAWCRGRGELIEPLESSHSSDHGASAARLPAWNLLLIKPPFSVDTAWAYAAWDKKTWPPATAVVVDGVEIFNDFEAPVFEKYLLLPVLKSWLHEQPEIITAWMSGSGSAMVALLQPELDAKKKAAQKILLEKKIHAAFGETFQIFQTLAVSSSS